MSARPVKAGWVAGLGNGATPNAEAEVSDLPRARDRQGKDRGALGEERVARLRRLDAEDPKGRWFLVLGSALRDLGHPLEALQVLRRGLARDPDCLGGWVVLGQCYLALDEIASARRVFSAVLGRDRHNALALRGLAIIYARNGDREQAAAYYRQLLKLVPRDVGAQRALADLLAEELDAETDESADLATAMGGRVEIAAKERGAEAPGEEKSSGEGSGQGVSEAAVTVVTTPVAEDEERASVRRRRSETIRFGDPREPRTARAAALRPEPRPSPGLFEPPPADLDWSVPAAVDEKRRRAGPDRERPRRDRRPAYPGREGELSEAGHRKAARKRADRRQASRADHERGRQFGANKGSDSRSNARSLSGYKRWLERMLEEGAGPGPRAGEE